MTYLELVNGVLRRLREKTVTTVDQTTYSTMVGDFVNDAKQILEGRWNWSANRAYLTVTTTPSTFTYALDTGDNRKTEGVKILTAYNQTSNQQLRKQSQAWMTHKREVAAVPTGQTTDYCFRGLTPATGDATIEVWPTPQDAETLSFYAYIYQDRLSDDSDLLYIPSLPVILLTVAMLAEEKGEAGGMQSARYFAMADRVISDAIMADAEKNQEEWIWYEV